MLNHLTNGHSASLPLWKLPYPLTDGVLPFARHIPRFGLPLGRPFVGIARELVRKYDALFFGQGDAVCGEGGRPLGVAVADAAEEVGPREEIGGARRAQHLGEDGRPHILQKERFEGIPEELSLVSSHVSQT